MLDIGSSLIVYHRCGGKSIGYHPNTLLTINWAIGFGAKAIEYDVVLCKDGKKDKIIMIEPKLLNEYNLDINNLLWKDIQTINAGNEKFGPTNVSLLDYVLSEVAKSEIAQQIQIKGENSDTVPNLLKKTKNTKNFIITAFDLHVIKGIKTLDKNVRVGWL